MPSPSVQSNSAFLPKSSNNVKQEQLQRQNNKISLDAILYTASSIKFQNGGHKFKICRPMSAIPFTIRHYPIPSVPSMPSVPIHNSFKNPLIANKHASRMVKHFYHPSLLRTIGTDRQSFWSIGPTHMLHVCKCCLTSFSKIYNLPIVNVTVIKIAIRNVYFGLYSHWGGGGGGGGQRGKHLPLPVPLLQPPMTLMIDDKG